MLPKSVKNVLWSEEIKKINPHTDKKIIICQVLNYGNKEALQWLLKNYKQEDIRRTASQIPLGQWDKKSLALWSLVFGVKPYKRSSKIK